MESLLLRQAGTIAIVKRCPRRSMPRSANLAPSRRPVFSLVPETFDLFHWLFPNASADLPRPSLSRIIPASVRFDLLAYSLRVW